MCIKTEDDINENITYERNLLFSLSTISKKYIIIFFIKKLI